MWSLRGRLTLSYVLISLFSVVLVSALANGLLERQFRAYVKETHEARNRQIAALLAGQLSADGSWDRAGISAVGVGALERGEIIRVTDLNDRIVWDAFEHNNGLCMQMLDHIAENMAARYPGWKGTLTENTYPIRNGSSDVGRVSVAFYGPFFFNEDELAFISALNRLLVWVALAALALSVGAGLVMARGISVPLSRVVAATQSIAGGNLEVELPLKSRTMEIDGIAAAVNDLSRSLRTQESLRKRLTADVAHELRTPLATLQSHLEALLDGVWTADERRLKDLHAEILRLNRMVADMENLASLESGSVVLKKTDVDLSELVSRIVVNHEAPFKSKGVGLTFNREEETGLRSGDGGAAAFVDPDRIGQVVINLLSNALKFTPAGGTVDVRAEADAESARITVSDTGCGIDPGDLPMVFERFYRADASRSRATGGTGIGLSIAKAIVEAHGGVITAESRPGTGSHFTVTLPRGGA